MLAETWAATLHGTISSISDLTVLKTRHIPPRAKEERVEREQARSSPKDWRSLFVLFCRPGQVRDKPREMLKRHARSKQLVPAREELAG